MPQVNIQAKVDILHDTGVWPGFVQRGALLWKAAILQMLEDY